MSVPGKVMQPNIFYERRHKMAEKVKSKTNVSARAGARNSAKICSLCGKPVNVVMSVTSSGKKSMRRLCCAA